MPEAAQESSETHATGTESPATPATPAPTSNSLEDLLAGLGDAERKAVLGEVSKARNEAAGYRTKLREVEPLAEEAKTLRESKQTDLQRLESRATSAEQASTEKDLQIARLTAVLTHGLQMEDVELLGGSSVEDIAAKAEKFAARLNAGRAGGRPKEQLRNGANPEANDADPDENDPAKLAARVLSRQYG